MTVVLFVFLMLVGSTPLFATQAPQKAVVGCLNRLSDGALQLGTVPSGELFLVQGHTKVIEEHVNQLVRVFGEPSQNGSRTLTVDRLQPLSRSCTSALPAKEFEEVPGKVGGDSVAVPSANTSNEDRTTPGFQTEAASAKGGSSSYTVAPPVAPTNPEQVAQSEAVGNAIAQSAERTEILPGHTLGVNGSAATPAPRR